MRKLIKKPSLKVRRLLYILALVIFITGNSWLTKNIVQNTLLGLGLMHISESTASFYGFVEDYDKDIIDMEYAQGKMRIEVERIKSTFETLEKIKV